MEQMQPSPIHQETSREIALTLGAMQLDLINAGVKVRDLERRLRTAEAELEGMKAERRATGNNVVQMPA